MAASINLICLDCREYTWIGQIPTGDRNGAVIYHDQTGKHARFCLKHWRHKLTIADDNAEFREGPALEEFEPEGA